MDKHDKQPPNSFRTMVVELEEVSQLHLHCCQQAASVFLLYSQVCADAMEKS